MAYSIEYHSREPCVRLTLQGETSLAEFELARAEAGALLAKHRTDHLVVDARQLANMISTLELFQFNSSHTEVLSHGVRIAGLVRSDQLPDGIFSENVAQNRGIMLKIFTDEETALAWLTCQSD